MEWIWYTNKRSSKSFFLPIIWDEGNDDDDGLILGTEDAERERLKLELVEYKV